MQRELEVQRREAERVQKELLALKKENSKLVAAANKFNRNLLFFLACSLISPCFLCLSLILIRALDDLKVIMRPPWQMPARAMLKRPWRKRRSPRWSRSD